MARHDMETFMQYQTVRSMREAANQKGGLAGVGAGMVLGNTMVQGIGKEAKSKAERLIELKSLLDSGILKKEKFDAEKKFILGK